MKRILCLVLAIMAIGARPRSVLSVTDYYIAVTGSDSNSGSAFSPWATLQHAADLAQPGWTIHVQPGDYAQTIYCIIPGQLTGTMMVCLQRSGTAIKPITFVSDSPWGARLACGQYGVGLFALGGSYIKVKDFDLTCPADGVFAIGTYGSNGHNTIVHNYVHEIGTTSCYATGSLFSGSAGHNTFDRNVVHHVGAEAGDPYHCIVYHGIYLTSPYDVATNNVISGVIGIGIHSYGSGVCHQTIANNTVFDNAQGGIIAENVGGTNGYPDACNNGGSTDYETITNNIVANNGVGQSYVGYWGGISLYGHLVGTHNVLSNTIAYGNQTYEVYAQSPAVSVNEQSGSDAAVFANYQPDPNWAPVPVYDLSNYASSPTSPAVDGGTPFGAPNHDVNNVHRPQGASLDIGAFEFVP